ncbi:MAG: hydroxyacylglutathione hydrolase [Gammaproteobacteria bacterium]|jgi:hydroxyacylglutathione hydrolase
MFLKQFYLSCLAHASYIVIDERTKAAAVIDPQRDIEQYIEAASRYGATIRYVLLTHFHADFIAGYLELRDRVGARIYLGDRAKAEYEFTRLKDGDALEFGDVRFRVRETPGHTPEGISVVVYDLAKNDREPEAVFTGDTLFVGDVGRPDLMASVGVSADELAGWLYDSLHHKLLELPDETVVYPAHGAGSMCGKNLSSETFSTIGEQRRFNYALQPMTRDEFKAVVTAEQPEVPAYFGYDAKLNSMERATLQENLKRVLQPLSMDRLLELRADGVQVLDVRDSADFAGSHMAGSINIGLGGKFATWAGTLLDREKKIVLVAEPGTEQEAAMRLGRIGLDGLVGYLDGGMGALADHTGLIATTDRITARALARQLDGPLAVPVVDVRTENEWEDGHIEGSLNLPLPHLVERISELPGNAGFALVCRSGYRSSIAASLLRENGLEEFRDTVGGMDAWTASSLPTTHPETPACQG